MDNDSNVDQIKELVRIEDVVSDYVQLQRSGSRLKALCPFHQEKTPSFYVNPEMNLYKCFGCGVGGDVFDFLMRIEHISFPEAGKRLAERVGLSWRSRPVDDAKKKRLQLIRRANKMAAGYFQNLLHSSQGEPALQYLHERGFSDEIIENFQLGYAADSWDALLSHLRRKGIDPEIAAEAGLAKERDSGGHYDAFRNRVMFPIIKAGGNVIAFGGRAMDPDDPAKYLNSADTPIFKKRQQLYGLNLANRAINHEDSVIVVEGYTDVLALHQAGIENTVACLGTALTETHLDLLGRYADEIILAYDADAAGMSAVTRNIAMLEDCAADVQIVVLPADLDPDDCIKKRGADGFRQVLNARKSPVEYEVQQVFAKHEDRGREGILQAVPKVVDILLRVRDSTRRGQFIDLIADRWGGESKRAVEAMRKAIAMELRRRHKSSQKPHRGRKKQPPAADNSVLEGVASLADETVKGMREAEKQLLCAALHAEKHAQTLADNFRANQFTDTTRQQLARAIIRATNESGTYEASTIIDRVADDDEVHSLAVELAVSPQMTEQADNNNNNDDDGEHDDEADLGDVVKELKKYYWSGGHRRKYEIRTADTEPAILAEDDGVEDFEKLRKKVAEKLNSGDCDPNDPDILRYKRIVATMHGSGEDADS